MKIYSWNVNGIRSAHKKDFLGWLSQVQPDILCLQEVRAEQEQIPSEILNYPGYEHYWNPAQRKGYSGTGVLTKLHPEQVNFGWGDPEFRKRCTATDGMVDSRR